MKKSRHDKIRGLLLESEDGLTTSQLAKHMGTTYKSLQKTMQKVWGIYIDRWAVPKRGQFAAVWMCVPVPESTPHPTERYLPSTVWADPVKHKGVYQLYQ